MQTPDRILQLVSLFKENENNYKSGLYNETQVRLEFINPFFRELGWDVDNLQEFAEAYKDVIHEDKIKIGGATKAPDYSFRIGGARKYFLEAKKPSVYIKEDISPAYQLRRYAWSAKLPLSVLTDFEEFAVYDCRIKPNKNDKASTARILYFTYKDYPEKWDEIYSIFSKTAVLKGSFDKYVESAKTKGTTDIDDAFLAEMEQWRELLARNFALRNPNLSTRALNEAVQKTIDRIVFLRICEDRAIEDYGQLQKLLNVADVYSHLRQIFLRADDKYNSGLFHFRSETHREDYDKWTLELALDDKPLKEIIKRLYYPESPYEFSVLPAEILGQVYERFLGKVIRLTAGHQAKIEEKPEVRKAGGVYYTPQYIVEYIVENTVGRLLNGEQGQGAGEQGHEFEENLNFYKQSGIHNEQYQNLQRLGSLEGSDEYCRESLLSDEKLSERRNLRSDQPNEESCSINTVEYSRGTRQNSYEGISESSVNSKGFLSGTGNSNINISSSELHYGRKNKGILGDCEKSGNVNKRSSQSSKQTPAPSPRPLTIDEAKKIKILDPACGSGSFLIGAYRKLLDWYLARYSENSQKYLKGKNPPIFQTGNNEYRLTIKEKKDILLNNIYGVDIDSQAVEVTKLSLLLKVLEGETEESLNKTLLLFKERALPDLCNNIKCGNSLIGPDFYDNANNSLFTEDDLYKINAFDWEKEFPEVFKRLNCDSIDKKSPNCDFCDSYDYIDNKNSPFGKSDAANINNKDNEKINDKDKSKQKNQINHINQKNHSSDNGFDVVIGNPPWVDIKGHDNDFVNYYFKKYKTTQNRINLYAIFIEKGIQIIHNTGFIGYIIPNSILYQSSYSILRKLLIEKNKINKIVRLPDNTFKNVKAESLVFIGNNVSSKDNYTECLFYDREDIIFEINNNNVKEIKKFNNIEWLKNNFYEFDIFSNSHIKILLEKIEKKSVILETLCDFTLGITPYDKYKGHTPKQIKEKVFHSNIKKDDTFKPLISGSEVTRFHLQWSGKEFISYGKWLGAPREQRFFTDERILIRQIVSGKPLRIYATYSNEKLYNTQTIFNIILKNNINLSVKFLLGIINSTLINFYHKYKFLDISKNLFQKILIQNCRKFPIREINIENIKEKQQHDKMVSLVEQMLELNKRLHGAQLSTHEKDLLKRQIEITDKQIDCLVYELYDLTEEEIKIVEGV